jgi:RNA recognition motif-containing protein
MKIYVGNLSYSTSEEDIRTAFSQFGTVDSVEVIMDRGTGRSKGFGFVEMSADTEGQAAIDALNGKDLDGRSLNVNVAKPREERPQRSSRY